MFLWRNKENINIFGLKKASYQELCLNLDVLSKLEDTTDITHFGLKEPYTMHLGPVVQSIISLTSLLMINLLAVVAQVFSNTLIFLLQKCECNAKATHILQQKISMY